MRWLLAFLIVAALLRGQQGWSRRTGLGRLRGDFHFRPGGRGWYVSLARSLVLRLSAAGVGLRI